MKELVYPEYLYLTLLILPVVFVYARNAILRHLPLYILFAIQISRGLLDYSGYVSENTINQASELIVFSLFLSVVIRDRLKYSLIILLSVLVFTLISFLFNNSGFAEFLLFIRRIVIIPMLIIYFSAAKYNRHNIHLESFIIAIVLVQPLAALFKVMTYGVAEEFIGTMSVGEGSITTNFALIAISYSFIMFLKTKNYNYFLIILIFVIFSMAGNKRATLFYIPISGFFIFYYYSIYLSDKYFDKIRNIAASAAVIVVSLFLILTFTESINPDSQRGGDIDFASEYIYDYLTNPGRPGVEGYGRAVAPSAVGQYLMNSGSEKLLTGMGPGILIPSRFSSTSYTTDKDILIFEYGIGYGARMGFLWTIFQIGIIGMLLYVFFYYYHFQKLMKLFKQSEKMREYQYELLLALSFMVVFFLDFFTYSQVMFKMNSAAIIFAYVTGTRVSKSFRELHSQ